MIRLMTLAAVAALAASGAAHAQPVRVSLAGKSVDQIHIELAAAARKVCMSEMNYSPLTVGAFSRCYKATLKTARTTLDSAVADSGARELAQR
jgi:hypothetical protein